MENKDIIINYNNITHVHNHFQREPVKNITNIHNVQKSVNSNEFRYTYFYPAILQLILIILIFVLVICILLENLKNRFKKKGINNFMLLFLLTIKQPLPFL